MEIVKRNETIKFLKEKLDQSIRLKCSYEVQKEKSFIDDISLIETKKEINFYMSAISTMEAFENFINNQN